MNIFLINTWNTLLASYQHRVYKTTLATVKHEIQQPENPTPAMVISEEAAHIDNAILLDYFTSEVALETDIGSAGPNIPMDNNCMGDKLHFGLTGGIAEYKDDGDQSDQRDGNPTTSQLRWAMTELQRIDLETRDIDGCEGDDGDNAEADVQEEASRAHDWSTQNV